MQNYQTIIGGKWWKVDFHLHSPGSYDYGHGNASQKKVSPKDYLKCCMKALLDCVVITDHNTFDWIPKLREAYKELKETNDPDFRELYIFPAVEFNAQGNVHLLGVFDPETDNKMLDAIPYLVEYNPQDETTKKSLAEVINVISEKGGIAIPAHVDGPSGLFYPGMKSTIVRTALSTGNLLALEVLGERIDSPELKEAKMNLTYVVGSDSHSTDTIGSRFTWVKMGIPNIEALRLALFDTSDGVIRDKDIKGNPNDRHGNTYISELVISNGKYIGRNSPYKVEFSPWLNSIIGGRGSGKSSLLKFMRLILNRGDELPEELLTEYNDFIKVPSNRTDLGMLQNSSNGNNGTEIIMKICVDGVSHQLKWSDNVTTEYNTDTGEWETAKSLKERFPVRLFSQKQLFAMTGDTNLLFEYLDSEWDYKNWKKDFDDLKDSYRKEMGKLHLLHKKQLQHEQLTVLLNDTKKKIGVFETEKTKEVLKKKEQLNSQIELLKKTYERYYGFINWIRGFDTFINLSSPEIEDTIESSTKKVIKKWCDDIAKVVVDLQKIIDGSAHLFMLREEWIGSLPISKQIEINRDEFDMVITELREAVIDDVDRYTELISEKEKLENEIESLGEVNRDIFNCESNINNLKKEWRELVKRRHDERSAVLKRWNELGTLRLSLISFGDLSGNENDFRQIIRRESSSVFGKEILEYNEGGLTKKGILYFMSKASGLSDKLEEFERMKTLVLNAPVELGKKFSDYLLKLFADYPESIAELDMWIPRDSLNLEINLNKKGRPLYRSIDIGSPGQRTSAILSLILGISEMPIIIDQPEDDLDTRNITDIIVASMNEMKKKQQIIVVTHNPNIVVNANSEQVIRLDYRNGQIINTCSGALQNHDVRDAICEVMEGGKEALEKRYYRIFKALEKG